MPSFRRFTLALIAISALLLPQATRAQEGKRVVKVMTRNMDAGTDLNLIFHFYPDVPTGVNATLAEVVASDMPGRAARLADEIRVAGPDFIALQEVTTWAKGDCGSETVLYDQLQLLLNALSARNMRYTVLAVNAFQPIEAPMDNGMTQCAVMADSDVVLGRANLDRTGIHVLATATHKYSTLVDFGLFLPGLPQIGRGYITVDVRAGGTAFHLVNTHLESTYPPPLDAANAIQVAQAAELLGALGQTSDPVLLLGDFNSNAETGPENTASYPAVVGAGFTDVWREFNPAGTGFTWPLFCEDFMACSSVANERIDLIFTRDLRALKVDRTGLNAPYASDHAGVTASIQVGK